MLNGRVVGGARAAVIDAQERLRDRLQFGNSCRSGSRSARPRVRGELEAFDETWGSGSR